MKKPLLFLAIAGISVLTACAQGPKTAKAGKNSGAARTAKQAASGLRGLTSVTMSRSACFGRCPEYSITIRKDGRATYTGKRFVDMAGVYEKKLDAAAAQALLQSFMDYRADTCRELYLTRIADLPGLHYTLLINGKEKKINNATFGPPYLVLLAEEIDKLAKVDASWKKTAGG